VLLAALGVGGYFAVTALTGASGPETTQTDALFAADTLTPQTFRADNWVWRLATPKTPGPLHATLPIRVSLNRDGKPAPFARATLTMRLDGSGDAVGKRKGVQLANGAMGFLVPARPMAAVFGLELRGELADGTTVNKRFRLDAETNTLTADSR
jgi:hypothetical protein